MSPVTAARRAQELCEFCPKMCRFSCPVSEVTGREALTPWGKVSLAALTMGRPDESSAMAFAGCTGCHRCAVYCAHDNDVPLPRPQGEALLFAGCDALAAGGEEARDALFVAEKMGAPLGLADALCCGLKLVEGGHPELSAAHFTRLGFLRSKKPLHLVFLQPGCARFVQEKLPEGSTAEHVTSYLARALAAMQTLPQPLPGSVVFHDPCALARDLLELTAPRALLAAALQDGLREPPRSGIDTSCCGAAGLLPRTMPDVARKLALDRRAELGEGEIVTSSPACAAALGAGEVVSLLRRWFSQ